MHLNRLIPITFVLSFTMACGQEASHYEEFPEMRGAYFGQKSPGTRPEAFAPGILNPPSRYHSSIVFSPDGTEAYWTGMTKDTYLSCMKNGSWAAPVIIPIESEYGIGEPSFFPGGQRLYFLSRRPPVDGAGERERIWYVERTDDGWSQPRLIDSVIARHPTHWQFSFALNGALYFTSEIEGVSGHQDVFKSEWNGVRHLEPVRLSDAINSDGRDLCPFIAPDESYLIVARSVPEENNRTDLFISFKDSKGRWLEAANMGDVINTLHNEVCPMVSPDGKYLFFLRVSGDVNQVYWVSTEVIEQLRQP